MKQKKKIRKDKQKNFHKFNFLFFNRVDLGELKRSKDKILELTSKLNDMEVSKISVPMRPITCFLLL